MTDPPQMCINVCIHGCLFEVLVALFKDNQPALWSSHASITLIVLTARPFLWSCLDMGCCSISSSISIPLSFLLMLRFHRTMDHTTSLCLISSYLNPFSPYHTQIHRTASFPFSLSLITPIVDRPLRYPVADPLSPYPCGQPYLVRYIAPQSSVTIRLDYVPSPQ